MIGRILNWITDFLSGRKQRVVNKDSRSSWRPVKNGTPHGSVIGPVLFLIYINKIPDKIASKIYLFADDAELYRQTEDKLDVTRIHEELQSLETFLAKVFCLLISTNVFNDNRNQEIGYGEEL